MTKKIELAPESPFHNIHATVRSIRARFPGITDHGVNQAVKRMLGGYNPRHPGRHVALFGADIMTATLEDLPTWPYLPDGQRRRLMDHPVTGGLVLDDTLEADDDPKRQALAQMEMANRLDRHAVNRSVLISPRGLSQTYVWSLNSGWVQEVTDADYALILKHPFSRSRFRDPDLHGPYENVRSYDGPGVVTQQHIAPAKDADYILRQLKAAPTWQGTDLPKS